MEQCQKRVENLQPPRKCELYAVGSIVIYPHGQPPVPPTPWVKHDQITEKPFVARDIPLLREAGKTRIDTGYPPAKKTKALAIGPGGQFFYLSGQESTDEAARRTLEGCASVAGVACMVVALDDTFVVPVPTTLKAIGFFQAATNSSIASEAKADLAKRLADAPTGWNAVAVGVSGRPGLSLQAASEQDAVNEALGNCVKRDSDCHVIAIGPFSVGPN
jgi:adenylate cyclase